MSGHAASVGGAALLVERIQEALREDGLAGWLLFDFHGTNPIARASAVMAECSALARNNFKVAAE